MRKVADPTAVDRQSSQWETSCRGRVAVQSSSANSYLHAICPLGYSGVVKSPAQSFPYEQETWEGLLRPPRYSWCRIDEKACLYRRDIPGEGYTRRLAYTAEIFLMKDTREGLLIPPWCTWCRIHEKACSDSRDTHRKGYTRRLAYTAEILMVKGTREVLLIPPWYSWCRIHEKAGLYRRDTHGKGYTRRLAYTAMIHMV